jgi:excisionase family DNA binding protein
MADGTCRSQVPGGDASGRGSFGIREGSMTTDGWTPAPSSAGGEPVILLLTAEEAARALRVGRSKVYELMRSGQLRSVKLGGSRHVSVKALAEFIAWLEEDAA